jgi:hypothetical protein
MLRDLRKLGVMPWFSLDDAIWALYESVHRQDPAGIPHDRAVYRKRATDAPAGFPIGTAQHLNK